MVGLAAVAQLLLPRSVHAQMPPAETPLAPPAWPTPMPLAQPIPLPPGPQALLRADKEDVRLQEFFGLGWFDICPAPCGIPVHPWGSYRVAGQGLLASKPLQLPRTSGDVVIDAHVGSKTGRSVGLGLIAGGLLLITVPAFLSGLHHSDHNGGYSRNTAIVVLSLSARARSRRDLPFRDQQDVGGGPVASMDLPLYRARAVELRLRS